MRRVISIWFVLLACCTADAQLLKDLLDKAKTNHPLLKAKRFESAAKEQHVRYEKSTAIPSIEAGYQVNYATYNNITGMATAQHFVPISGPPSASNSNNAVFGSAGGLLMNWELFAFGQHKSRVGSAEASLQYQQADEENEVFQHQIRTADAYLDLLMAQELVKVYQRNLARSEDNLRIVRSLARSGLRPGVDTALFKSELAKTKIELLNFERLRQEHQLKLSELLGENENGSFEIDSSYCSALPALPDTINSSSHPFINLATSRLKISEVERKSLQRSIYPRLSMWGSAYGRGSGIRYDGYTNAEDGLSLSRYNFGAGLVLSVPLLQFTRTQHQVHAQDARVQADQERLNGVTLQINKQQQLAAITLSNSLKVAIESPAFFEASRYAYKGLLSRYNSGLINYTELIQSQYVLLQSEVDLKKAHIEAWKALLFMAAVNGDLNIFTSQL